MPSRERLGLPAVPIGKRRRGLPQIHWLTGERLALGQQVSRRLVVAVGQAIQAFSVLWRGVRSGAGFDGWGGSVWCGDRKQFTFASWYNRYTEFFQTAQMLR